MIDKLDDRRIGCLSIMTSLPIGEFVDLVERAYVNRGGLQGQRPALKTKTALTIRERLVSDLRNGAVVPPVVIGIHCLDQAKLSAFRDATAINDVIDAIRELPDESISIIDGMQRTTAFLEAGHDNAAFFDTVQRFELWVSDMPPSVRASAGAKVRANRFKNCLTWLKTTHL